MPNITHAGPLTIKLTDFELPDSIGRLLGGLNQQNITGEFPGALSMTENGKYTIHLNEDKLAGLDMPTKRMLVIHEIMHLAHGHLPYAVLHKLDPKWWNVATDAWINRAWPDSLIDAIGGVTYTKLREELPELPAMLMSPRIIYDLIMREVKANTITITIGAQDLLTLPDKLTEDGKANASVEQIAAIQAVRDALNDPNVSDQLKQDLERLLNGASPTGGERAYTKGGNPIIPYEWLAAVLARLRGHSIHGDYRRTRGWYRPGRIDYVAGSRKGYGPLVLVAIDVSGSTCNYWPGLIAAADILSKRYRVQVCVYANQLLYTGAKLPGSATPTGGGTNFGPVFRHADKIGAHLMVNITDGDNADHSAALPHCPIAWVYLPSSTKHTLRPGDTALKIHAKST